MTERRVSAANVSRHAARRQPSVNNARYVPWVGATLRRASVTSGSTLAGEPGRNGTPLAGRNSQLESIEAIASPANCVS
jgi:hypothetical protein